MRPKRIVLCVDDNETTLSVRKFLLETWGYFVLTATSGEQALAMAKGMRFDLLLTDLVMPHMNGNELVRRMKLIDPELKTVIISGSVKSYGRGNHAEAFVPKGMPVAQLLLTLKALAMRKRGPKKQVDAESALEAVTA